ncbi:MAG: UvrD-helicase domain-containing protein [Alphaproteobacteria bacterium]|nr:UvrD-helicase domain-containing protein [Alphaproteobacteria bacterium]
MSNIFDFNDEDDAICSEVFDNISALKPMQPNFVEGLNPEQADAVLTTEGALLVLAGAGTGKTKVLTTRLAHILNSGIARPWNCLVVTFTNKAANEMKERVRGFIGDTVNSVWLGTFHSICVKILRRYPELVGLKDNFTILGEDDQKRVIKKILQDNSIDEKQYTPQAVLEKISRFKDKGLTIEKVVNDYKTNTTTLIYKEYQARLLELNCVDFGDILLYVLDILLKNPNVLNEYQERFKYIMVDEYQDTNVTQYLLLRLLSQKYRNICCVGDDDQSIYSWRGAEIENILKFNNDFPEAKTIRLERNYRSTENILTAASSVISHNSKRLGKTLRVAEHSPVSCSKNEKIKVVSNYGGDDEAKYIADKIKGLKYDGFNYEEIAVLVRTASQTRALEEVFIKESIPYKVVGGLKFYERAEIRDMLAYFRLILQPSDDLAFERIINKPARGIGEKTIDKIRDRAKFDRTPLYQTMVNMVDDGEFSGKTKNALQGVIDLVCEWRKILPALSLGEFAEQVVEESSYMMMLEQDKSVEAPGRIENIKELLNVMSDRETYPDLATFLEHVSLVIDNEYNDNSNKVIISTLHAAKGLEFDAVFLPGWEEGIFPHQKCLDCNDVEGLEEERRLAYVAITRAKRILYITMAFNRKLYGQWQNYQPSRFINELPPKCIELVNNTGYAKPSQSSYNSVYGGGRDYYRNNNFDNSYSKNNYSNYDNSYKKKEKSGYFDSYENSFYDDEYDSYESNGYYRKKVNNDYFYQSKKQNPLVGIRVYHPSFGYGRIINVDGDKCEVMFDKAGKKKIMGSFLEKC